MSNNNSPSVSIAQQRTESYERINRIEEKLDKLAEAVVALARAEEKIQTLTSFSKQQSEMIIGLGERLTKVEELVHANASTVNIINKIFWIIISASAVAISGMLFLQVQ
jgi:ribosome-binding ATPase YchF (GTP1/OBG family)